MDFLHHIHPAFAVLGMLLLMVAIGWKLSAHEEDDDNDHHDC
jgi:hypothetical protein